jgi:hypothetical protein
MTTPKFRIKALPAEEFAPLFTLGDAELAVLGAARVIADKQPGYPCRVSLADAEPGEELLLLHYEHHAVASPYRAAGPIYVRRNAATNALGPGEIPDYVARRLVSVRAYDSAHWMVEALVSDGHELRPHFARLFEDQRIAYLHLHNAKQGCYSCCVERT